LEKEILLLKTLGSRLEAKLYEHGQSKKSVTTSVTDLRTRVKRVWSYVIVMPQAEAVAHVAELVCLKHVFGIIKEFHIVKKTLLELKQEADKEFYIPQHSELKCTSFKRLQEKPQVLRRYLQPKDPQKTFNLFEHDALFIKDFYMNSKSPWKEDDEDNGNVFNSTKSNRVNDGGDSIGLLKHKFFTNNTINTHFHHTVLEPSKQTFAKDNVQSNCEEKVFSCLVSSLNENNKNPIQNLDRDDDVKDVDVAKIVLIEDVTVEDIPEDSENVSQSDQSGVATIESGVDLSESPSKRSTRKRHNRRKVTPLPADEVPVVEPKNRLIKYTFLAAVQMSMLILVFAAFAIPDWTCK